VTPRVTVAVSSYGRAPLLPRLVAALEAQTLPPDEFEVVVVDDASPDGTGDVLERLARGTPLHLTVLRNDTNAGPARGRNRAWRAGSAPYVAFTDDDCLPRPDWLANGLRSVSAARRVCVGRVVPNPEQAANHGPFSRTLRVEGTRFFQTANVFYARADLEAVGGLEETFRRAGGEDVDLGLRVVANGAEAVFASDAEVWHDVRPSDFRAALRETRKWSELPLVARRHPDVNLGWKPPFWKRSHAEVLALLVGVTAAKRHPAALLLAAPWARSMWGRSSTTPDPADRAKRIAGQLVLDTAELAVLTTASVRHRKAFL
jgi:GT2 family glycosyltransferase